MRHRSWHTGKTTGRAPLNRVQILHDRVGIFVGVTQATQLAHDELALPSRAAYLRLIKSAVTVSRSDVAASTSGATIG